MPALDDLAYASHVPAAPHPYHHARSRRRSRSRHRSYAHAQRHPRHHGRRLTAPRSKGSDVLLGFASFLLPMVGLIMAVVFLSQRGRDAQRTGSTCMLWSVIGLLFGALVGALIWAGANGAFVQEIRV